MKKIILVSFGADDKGRYQIRGTLVEKYIAKIKSYENTVSG